MLKLIYQKGNWDHVKTASSSFKWPMYLQCRFLVWEMYMTKRRDIKHKRISGLKYPPRPSYNDCLGFFFNKSNMFKLSMFKLSSLPSRALPLWLYPQKGFNRLSTSFCISFITAIYKRHPLRKLNVLASICSPQIQQFRFWKLYLTESVLK